MSVFLIVNGPNLNTLGTRQPELYGTKTLAEIIHECRDAAGLQHTLTEFQSNHEGALIDFLQQHATADGAIMNPGGLAHTSVVLRDAVAACAFPVVEVHITDIAKREPFRQHSYLAEVAAHHVIGKGVAGYRLALEWLMERHGQHG